MGERLPGISTHGPRSVGSSGDSAGARQGVEVPGECVELFGSLFVNLSRQAAADAVIDLVGRKRQPAAVVCVQDVGLVVQCNRHPELRRFYDGADLLFVDGRGLVYASHLLGQPLREMVGGPGLYEALLQRAASRPVRFYFLGGTSAVVRETVRRVAARHPHVAIVGSRDGYFPDGSAQPVFEELRQARPDIVFVGMPTPKRERFLSCARNEVKGCVFVAVGGMFDVEAGLVRLAPRIVSYCGLEWLYRCVQEPRRLLGRYARTHPRFLILMLVAVLQRLLGWRRCGRGTRE